MVESEAVAKIRRILDEARRLPGFPNLGEADTCWKVILRLLHEVSGYSFADWVAQPFGVAGDKPDFVFLPDTKHTWCLEAKAWNITLTGKEEAQLAKYVVVEGVRWGVLTNGREWRLYDNTITLKPQEKLAAQADEKDISKLAEFLKGISKESMQSGRIADYALSCRLARILDAELKDPNSEIVQALVEKLNGRGLAGVTGEHVVGYFERRRHAKPPISPLDDSWQMLADLLEDPKQVRFTKPLALRMPDSLEITVATWRAIILEALRWFHQAGKLPPPPYPAKSGRLYNTAPTNTSGRAMGQPTPIEGVGYVDTWLGADDVIKFLGRLCKDTGTPPDSISIRLTKPAK